MSDEAMRLDKFLKVTGLIPRRTVAKEACDAGRVRLNGQPGKASSTVSVGDRVAFDLGRGTVDVEVLEVPRGAVGRDRRQTLYRTTADRGPEGETTAQHDSEGSP